MSESDSTILPAAAGSESRTGAAGQEPLRCERRGPIGLLRLEGPEGLVVLSLEVREVLATALERWDRDPEIRCMVIAGSDRAFVAGADIAELCGQDLEAAMTSEAARLWPRLAAIRKPLVAAVSGHALGGGCELALACDLIVASETAVFGQPEIRLGIIPGGGATQRLPRLLGRQLAMELVLTGRSLDAGEARDLGIVNRLVPAGTQVEEALALAEVIARRPPIAVRLAKEALRGAEELPLTAGLELERRLYELSMATEDRREGMRAFLEKRDPRFAGR